MLSPTFIFLLLVAAGPVYLHFRLFQYLWPQRLSLVWYWLLWIGSLVVILGLAAIRNDITGFGRDAVLFFLVSGIGLLLLLLFWTVVRDVVFLCISFSKYIFDRYTRATRRHSITKNDAVKNQQSYDPKTSRRDWLQRSSWGILGLTGVEFLYGYKTAQYDFEISEVKIPVGAKVGAFAGYRIAQITDLHIGRSIKTDFVRRVVEEVNQIRADMIVLTGDIFDDQYMYIQDAMIPLKDLSAKDGVFWILGNHEYYTSEVDTFIEKMQAWNIHVLRNDTRHVIRGEKTLLLAGFDDPIAERIAPQYQMDVHKTLQRFFQAQQDRYLQNPLQNPLQSSLQNQEHMISVALAHRPHVVTEIADFAFDLQISGHTHGGQLWPGPWLLSFVEPYLVGLYRVKNTWLYVSRGTGYWGPPLRVGAAPEIACFHLVDHV